jgi:uncharacterized phage protein gp47/JayE
MGDILNVYTADQLFEMYKNKIIADAVGLTDFNVGSKTRALLESNSELISSICMDFKEAIYKAIPIALYQGFGFEKKSATAAVGYIRPYRKPAMYIAYTGSGTSALITTSATTLTVTVTGAPGDAISRLYSASPKTSDMVTYIDGLANWSATLVSDVDCDTLYQYTAVEILGKTTYLATTGMDLMLATDTEIEIPQGFSCSVDNLEILTSVDATLEAGESGVQIESECGQTGTDGNISAGAIDTLNGLGSINSTITGIQYAINDTAFSGGTIAETDIERQTRFSETVSSLNAGTKAGIISAIKGITSVRSVGMRTSYPFKGNNTIIVDDGTQTISAELLEEIEKVLYGDPSDIANYPGKNAEGIGYTITVPTIVDVSIGITAYRLPTVKVDLTTIKADIETAVEQYVNTRGLGEDVVLSEVVRIGKNSNAAIYDLVVTSPLTNVAVNENEFAKTGAGTGGTVTATVSIATSL